MIDYYNLYKTCKSFTIEFEKAERKTINYMAEQLRENKEKEEIKKSINFNEVYQKCEPYAISLHSTIVADFISSLNDEKIKQELLSSLNEI